MMFFALGLLCGVTLALVFAAPRLSNWTYRARLAEQLLELEKRYRQEDAQRHLEEVSFEKEHVQRMRALLEAAVAAHRPGNNTSRTN